MEDEKRTARYDSDLKVEAYRFQGIMQKFPNHFHEYYVIGFIESGQRYLSCKNKDYTVGPGDLLLFNPLDNHTCEQIDNKTLDYRCINIKPEIMKNAALEIAELEYLPQFTQPVVFNSELVSLLQEIHKMIMDGQTGIQKEEAFLFLLEHLINKHSKPFPNKETDKTSTEIRLVCEYLEKNYKERISLHDLSSISGINKYCLLRFFTRIKGITPYRYLETIRINNAKKMLEQGVEPLDVAMLAGFSDQSHFTNFFKDFIGLTPKQYQSIFIDDDK